MSTFAGRYLPLPTYCSIGDELNHEYLEERCEALGVEGELREMESEVEEYGGVRSVLSAVKKLL